MKYRSYFNSISIKNKIFAAMIILVVLSITVFAFFANNVSRKAIIEKAMNNSLRELVLINNNIETLITNVEDYSKMLATDYRLQEVLYTDMSVSKPEGGLESLIMRKKLSEIISNFVEPNTKVKAASVLSSRIQWADVGYADNEYAARLFGTEPVAMKLENNNKPIWTELVPFKFRYDATESNVFAVSKAVVHKEFGKTIGMVALYVKESVIAAIYENSLNYQGGEFYILDAKHRIISSRNKSLLYHDFTNMTSISLPSLDERETSFILGKGNEKLLVSTQHFEPLSWTIISVIPLDVITVENKKINQLIIRTGILCLIFAMAISFFLSRSITKPLLILSSTMRKIRNGQMNVRSAYQSMDEIGHLSDGFNSLMDRIEALVAKNAEEERTKSEIEFKLLQSQVKPHFLYNTVETIISLIKLNMKTEAIAAAKYMANFYNISLSRGNDVISIRQEMKLTESYLEIQKLRYVEYMDYSMDIDEDIMRYATPKLMLQPIVENAIYHGLKWKKEKGTLQIAGFLRNGQIIIEVYDNGVGMDKQQMEQLLEPAEEDKRKVSFGARSVNSRIKMLFGDQYGLEIESVSGSYTKVTIRLPLQEL
ncbi:sensor histidine kinase [Paenibacillus soyae]|uniref:Sensor histidine kinase n=1 Tax=Paenibacillus soyae TaxID=2969249 RepID=A0A9X2MQ97_9BACL|nr:sensor histidine kinase [Paenibacillus soyae]MCR2806278.1 sensor histidine kinase [Paenibacillus soyae]